ncbi:unnamed protein product [Darwinula stevensoni]|uniref:Uncharacterized protein n=1 Tax=Darwinula stevensoni TaxID=69355 RepID=A0A7R9AA71_9CRUS|nr:unnamed protein product [Darwinula stevensoni]CAG0897932.1 unnamed protein product [Darwinula stevensoni]
MFLSHSSIPAISLEGEFGAGPVVDNIPVHGIPVKSSKKIFLPNAMRFFPSAETGSTKFARPRQAGLHGCCHGTVDLRFHSLPDRGSSKPTWSSEDLQLLEGSPHRVLVLSKRLRNRMPMETAAMIARQRSSNEVNGEGAVPRDDKASLPDASSFANWPFAEVVYGVRSHV